MRHIVLLLAPFLLFAAYREGLKNRIDDKEAAQIFCSGASGFALGQAESEDKKFAAKPMQSATGFSVTSGICPFCNSDVIERQSVAKTDLSAVLYCLTPLAEGHLLIVPNRHITRFEELTDEEMVDLYHLIQKVQEVYKQYYGITDYLVLQKNGRHAGQTVDHVHIHTHPCPPGLDLKEAYFKYHSPLSDEDMQKITVNLKPYFE